MQELTVQKEELSQSITEMQAAADKETENLHELQEQKTAVRKEILKLSSDKKVTEKNIHVIRENPEWQLPEPGMMTTAKAYRDKKAVPLLEKVKETLVSVLIRNVQLSETVDKLKRQIEQLKKKNRTLEEKVVRLERENDILQEESRNYGYLKAELGEQGFTAIVEKQKALEISAMVSRQKKKEEVSR